MTFPMNLSLVAPSPLEYFRTLVQSDAQFPLLEAAISLAQDEYPQLDVQQVLAEVDQLLGRLKRRIPADAPASHRLRMLNQYFFRELHFRGNVNDYYDPGNSYLNVVLHSRRGIPISLAVLWLELAQGLGLAARGVGFPGHFMVKVNLPHGQVVIDPFTGQSLSREALAERLEPFRRRHGLLDELEAPLGLYLQVTPARDIIARMLHNLKEIHASHEDWARQVAVLDRLLVLQPQAWEAYRDRGLAHAELGQVEPAVRDLETYLSRGESQHDVAAIMARLAELRHING
jgi:regulator of sirC expression with transglutaminase-like and TPR domain